MGRTALFVVIVLVIAFGYMMVSIYQSQEKSPESIDRTLKYPVVRNLANTYAKAALNELKTNLNWTTGYNVQNVAGIDRSRVKLTVENYNTNLSLNKGDHIITSVASVPLNKKSAETVVCTTLVNFKQIFYAEYALFVNTSLANGYYGTGEEFFGPVHINGYVSVGDKPGPVFHDNVTSTDSVRYFNGATAANYKGFLGANNNFHNERVTYEQDVDMNALGANNPDAFRPPSTAYKYIELLADGSVKVSKYEYGTIEWQNNTDAIIKKVDDIVKNNKSLMYFTNDVYVRGTLKGKISIATTSKMYAAGSVTYTQDPREDKNSQDMLGLMSKGDFVVLSHLPQTESAVNVDGCTIMGSIITQSSVVMDDYKTAGNRGNFTNVGGRTQKSLSITYDNINNMSQRWKYNIGTVVDAYGNKYNYLISSSLIPRGGSGKNEEYEFEEKLIRLSNGRTERRLIVKNTYQISITDHTGYKEVGYYDERYRYEVPPQTPYSKHMARIVSWQEIVH